MSTASRRLSFVSLAGVFISATPTSLRAAEMRFHPVAATGNVICLPGEDPCEDNEIILSDGGVTVTLFLEMREWDLSADNGPLGAFQGSLDSDTLAGGIPGNPWTLEGVDLLPVGHPDMGFEGAFQALRVCTELFSRSSDSQDLLSRCESFHDCSPEYPFCVPRLDFVFAKLDYTATVSTATANYTWSSASTDCAYEDRYWKYGGTLELDVPLRAPGTYNIDLLRAPDATFFKTCEGSLIPDLTLPPAQITIATGRCCSNIRGIGTAACEDDLVPSECDTRPEPRIFTHFEQCTGKSIPDCNDNGVPDECEILAADCNENAIPDDCELDSDDDLVIDACDGCPDDPNKTEPGLCGCGIPYTDADCDGVADEDDLCPGIDDNTYGPDCAGKIPAVSIWGVVVLALLLLALAKISFRRGVRME